MKQFRFLPFDSTVVIFTERGLWELCQMTPKTYMDTYIDRMLK
jgi:hypothetical protein